MKTTSKQVEETRIEETPKKLKLVLSLLFNENSCFFADINVRVPCDDRKIIPVQNNFALPIFFCSKPSWCLGVGYSNHTNIRNGAYL